MTAKRPPEKAPAKAGAVFTGDIAELAAKIPDFPLEWAEILSDWRKGKVDRARVIRALESGHRVPEGAEALFAGLLDGSITAVRGNKKSGPRPPDSFVARTVEGIETMLRDPERIPDDYSDQWRVRMTALRMRTTGAPNAKAREMAAELFGIGKSELSACITRNNAALRKVAAAHGVKLADVKRALKYGEP